MNWLDTVRGQVVVVKFGGNAMLNDSLLETFAQDVAFFVNADVKVIVVHGGGPQITSALGEVGIESEFVNGLRVTPASAIQIIERVLREDIGVPIASMLQKNGLEVEVLNGKTKELLLAERTHVELGLVGEVFAVRDLYLRELLANKVVPVISSVAPDEDGNLLNVNADLAAASIASSCEAKEVIFLTDVEGLYSNYPDPDSKVDSITTTELEKLLPSLDSGMVPKVQACLAASYGGVKVSRILDGRENHVLQKLAQDENRLGTKVITQ